MGGVAQTGRSGPLFAPATLFPPLRRGAAATAPPRPASAPHRSIDTRVSVSGRGTGRAGGGVAGHAVCAPPRGLHCARGGEPSLVCRGTTQRVSTPPPSPDDRVVTPTLPRRRENKTKPTLTSLDAEDTQATASTAWLARRSPLPPGSSSDIVEAVRSRADAIGEEGGEGSRGREGHADSNNTRKGEKRVGWRPASEPSRLALASPLGAGRERAPPYLCLPLLPPPVPSHTVQKLYHTTHTHTLSRHRRSTLLPRRRERGRRVTARCHHHTLRHAPHTASSARASASRPTQPGD